MATPLRTLHRWLNRRLSFVGLLVAISVLTVAAGLAYEVHAWISAERLHQRVQATVPRIRDELRLRRKELVGAIESYRAATGSYPPDHVVSRNPLIVDAVTNQLLYELLGTVFDPTRRTFSANVFDPIGTALLRELFGVEGFKNSAPSGEAVRRFLPLSCFCACQIRARPDVGVLGFIVDWSRVEAAVGEEFAFTPWHYVSTSPTHNSTAFDLWIEMTVSGTNVLIGNWRSAE